MMMVVMMLMLVTVMVMRMFVIMSVRVGMLLASLVMMVMIMTTNCMPFLLLIASVRAMTGAFRTLRRLCSMMMIAAAHVFNITIDADDS